MRYVFKQTKNGSGLEIPRSGFDVMSFDDNWSNGQIWMHSGGSYLLANQDDGPSSWARTVACTFDGDRCISFVCCQLQ